MWAMEPFIFPVDLIISMTVMFFHHNTHAEWIIFGQKSMQTYHSAKAAKWNQRHECNADFLFINIYFAWFTVWKISTPKLFLQIRNGLIFKGSCFELKRNNKCFSEEHAVISCLTPRLWFTSLNSVHASAEFQVSILFHFQVLTLFSLKSVKIWSWEKWTFLKIVLKTWGQRSDLSINYINVQVTVWKRFELI